MNTELESERNFIYRFLSHHEMGHYYELHPGKALVEGEYDGKKEDFERNIYKLLVTARLREYGLLNKLPFFVRNLIEVLEDPLLANIAELNVAHYGAKLIRMRNSNGSKDKLEVLHFDIGDIFEYLLKETVESNAKRSALMTKHVGLCALSYYPLGRFVFLGVALGIAVVVAESVRMGANSVSSYYSPLP